MWKKKISSYLICRCIYFTTIKEKEMATYSSILAWRIPGTGEPDGLLSMGSHRVEHDWSDLAAAAAVVVKNLPAVQETQVQSLGQKDPLEKEWQPTSVFLPRNSHGQRSLAGSSPQSRTQLSTQTDRLESFCKIMLIGMSHLFPFLLSCYSDLVLIFI